MSALCQLLCASLVIITAQNEEMFYSYGFDAQLDWMEDIGTYNADVHTFIPIQWLSASTDCPRAIAGETSADAKMCVLTKRDASISRIISTVGFHSIHLQIDVKAQYIESYSGDWCIIQYRTAASNWINTNIVQELDYVLNYEVFITDNDVYNNQDSFEVKIGTYANSGPDNCYFDNLKLFGIPSTETPTLDTNHPTKNPSRSPLVEPTLYPTKHPTSHPSTNPTKHPSNEPTKQPTSHPSTNPTKVTKLPTLDPTSAPTEEPTSHPSTNPSKLPTSSPILSPTVNPTSAPTFSYIYVTIVSQSTQNTFGFTEQRDENDGTLITIMIVLIISIVVSCIICVVFYFKVYQIFIAYDSIKTKVVNTNDDEIQCWLRDSVKLPQYHSCFVEHGYNNMAFIKNIGDKSDLKAIGIQIAGHRTRIWAEIKILRNEDKKNPDGNKPTEGLLSNKDLWVAIDNIIDTECDYNEAIALQFVDKVSHKRNKDQENDNNDFGQMLGDKVMGNVILMEDIVEDMDKNDATEGDTETKGGDANTQSELQIGDNSNNADVTIGGMIGDKIVSGIISTKGKMPEVVVDNDDSSAELYGSFEGTNCTKEEDDDDNDELCDHEGMQRIEEKTQNTNKANDLQSDVE